MIGCLDCSRKDDRIAHLEQLAAELADIVSRTVNISNQLDRQIRNAEWEKETRTVITEYPIRRRA